MRHSKLQTIGGQAVLSLSPKTESLVRKKRQASKQNSGPLLLFSVILNPRTKATRLLAWAPAVLRSCALPSACAAHRSKPGTTSTQTQQVVVNFTAEERAAYDKLHETAKREFQKARHAMRWALAIRRHRTLPP